MSFEAVEHVFSSRKQPSGRKLVLLAIAHKVGEGKPAIKGPGGRFKEQRTWVGNEALASMCEMTVRNVQMHLAELEFDGDIRIEMTGRGRGATRFIYFTFKEAAKGEAGFTLPGPVKPSTQGSLGLVTTVAGGLDRNDLAQETLVKAQVEEAKRRLKSG